MSETQKTLGGEFQPNAERYRKAAEPHESPEAANEALAAFYEAVGELRVKHRMRDVLVICSVALVEADGTEACGMSTIGYGSQHVWESMAAYAYGRERSNRETRTRELMTGKAD